MITVLDYIEQLSPAAKIAAEWDIVDVYTGDKWNAQVRDAATGAFLVGDEYINYRQSIDEEILAIKYAAGEDVKTKAGKWKWSKVCTKSTYRSNCSLIKAAIDNGVALLQDGEVVPKNKLGKLIKQDSPEIHKTAYDKCISALQTLAKNMPELTESENREVAIIIGGLT